MSDTQHNRTSVEPQALAASLPQSALGWSEQAEARPGIRLREEDQKSRAGAYEPTT